MGLACALHVTANRQMANWDGSSVAIKVNEDGRMNLITAEADIGQGAATVLTQIAAEVLGIPPEHIVFTTPDTDVAPYTFGAAASRTTFLAGHAVVRAARAVRERLLAVAAQRMEVAPEDLTVDDGVIHVVGLPDRRMTVGEAAVAHLVRPGGEGFERAAYDAPTVMADTRGYGNVAPAYTFAAQAAEVSAATSGTATRRRIRPPVSSR